jgi:hypothetical protein
MLSFLKRFFGAKSAQATAAPYKVEGSEHFPFPKETKSAAKPKKPAAKKAPAKTVKKPKTPKA